MRRDIVARSSQLQLLDLALEFRFVLKAIVAGQATHDFAALQSLRIRLKFSQAIPAMAARSLCPILC